MTTREQLHERIDALPEDLLEQAAERLDEIAVARQANEERARQFLADAKRLSVLVTAESHPEWATPEDVIAWVRKQRAEWDDRERSNATIIEAASSSA